MRVSSFEALRVVCLALPAWTACASPPAPSAPNVTEIMAVAPAVATPEVPPPAGESPPRPVRAFALPRDWSALDRATFATELAAWTKDGAVLQLDDAGLAELGRALAASDATSVRAAVILANTRDPRAFDVLVQRLEARVPEGSRNLAGDVVAAAACAAVRPVPEAIARLEALASGPRPHAAFAVRVECALTSLDLGRDACVPFLLDVLREGTSAAAKNPSWRRLDWTDERSLRLQDRIAHALSARAGIECAYRARGPLAAREKEIARLAQLLQNSPAPK